jgi:hypothetical protein
MNNHKLFLFVLLLTLSLAQQSRRGYRPNARAKGTEETLFDSFINNVVNKISRIGYSLMAIVGSAFAYYKFFRKSKQRK